MFKVLLTDVDEIIFSWHAAFSKWIRLKEQFRGVGNIADYKTLEEWLNCDTKTLVSLITEFNRTSEFMDLRPRDDATEYLPKLFDKGYKFIAISACAQDNWTYTARWNNLQRYFPEMFIGLHCVGLGERKFEYLSLYHSTIWVEDSFSHALDGAKAGHRSFLFDYKHNENRYDDSIIRIEGWKNIYNYVDTLETHQGYLCI